MSLFSRLLDALIFTSAIAITAYNYLTGTLPQPIHNGPSSSSSTSSSRYSSSSIQQKDQKRKRIQQWAEQQMLLPSQPPTPIVKRRTTLIIPKEHIIPYQKKRTQSLPVNTKNKEDQVLSKIQFLIQQGEEALSSPVSI